LFVLSTGSRRGRGRDHSPIGQPGGSAKKQAEALSGTADGGCTRCHDLQ